MALRDSMRASAQPYLRPTETIQSVFPAQTADQLLILGGVVLFLIVNKYRMFVVTNERIMVLNTGKWNFKKARGAVVAEIPREFRFGQGAGLWHVIIVGRESLRINRRFFKDVEAADAQAPAAA